MKVAVINGQMNGLWIKTRTSKKPKRRTIGVTVAWNHETFPKPDFMAMNFRLFHATLNIQIGRQNLRNNEGWK
jgi:hypothetical protein